MERVWSTSRRGFSVRSILTFVLTVFIAALLWVTFGSHTPTHALDDTTASWKGESLIYHGHQYFKSPDAEANNSLGLPQDTHYYVYLEEKPVTGQSVKTENAFIIYFAPGADPPTAKTASLMGATYTLATQQYSNLNGKTAINVDAQDSSTYNSCSVEGIGWIICPVTVFLADTMDNIFKFVSDFMKVQPLTAGDTTSSLYIAWNVMRTIANVAFIIAFLIIIYSQITNVGLSNYGLKKLLPRLIIAAVLVNVSYIICSIAVDLSNILGFSIQQILVDIRHNTFAITNDTWSSTTTAWTTITTVILSGGAVGVAGVALAGDVVGALYVLLPILLGVIITALFVLLILAARQAIIVILIIISPLAFVAYLLPNTEQWFKKWRELLMTMLIFFPAFSLVFGGSQLASSLILQNASSVLMIILGLAVQVAPLAITPLILRFSGGVLGRVAGMINDPKKGLMDRTKNWSKDRQEMRRLNSLRKTGTANPFRKTAQFLDNNGRRVKERTALYTSMNDNRYNDTARHEEIYQDAHHAETTKKGIDARLERNLNNKINTNRDLFQEHLEVDTATRDAARTKQALETSLTEAQVGVANQFGPQTASMTHALNEAGLVTRMQAAETARKQSADTEVQKMIAQAFNVKLNDDGSNQAEFMATKALLNVAGGIQGSVGITRARANATAALGKIEAEATDNNLKLLGAEAMLNGTSLKIHTSRIVTEVLAGRGDQYEKSVIEAALEAQAQDGQVGVIEQARGSKFFTQSDVAKVIARNIGTMKEKGGFHLQAEPDLNIEFFMKQNPGNEAAAEAAFKQVLNLNRIGSLGDTSANNISGLKAGWLEEMAKLLTGPDADTLIASARGTKFEASLEAARDNFDLALSNENIRATIGDRIPEVESIRDKLLSSMGPVRRPPAAPQQTATAPRVPDNGGSSDDTDPTASDRSQELDSDDSDSDN